MRKLKPSSYLIYHMGLLPDTKHCGLRMRRECRESFPRHWLQRKNASKRSRHASRHVRDARAVMYVGIACLPAEAGKTFPAFPVHAQPAILRIW